jgi:hypothetical protein
VYRELIRRRILHVKTKCNGERLVDFAAAKRCGGIFNPLATKRNSQRHLVEIPG